MALTEQTEISKYSLDLDKINPCDANLCLNGATCAALLGLTNNCTVNVIPALMEQTVKSVSTR